MTVLDQFFVKKVLTSIFEVYKPMWDDARTERRKNSYYLYFLLVYSKYFGIISILSRSTT